MKKQSRAQKRATPHTSDTANASTLAFGVLESLSRVKAVRDFRLKDVMSDLGLDSRQPAVFYRALVREASDILNMVDDLRSRLETANRSCSQAQSRAVLLGKELAAAKVEIADARNATAGLEASVAEFQPMATSYQALKAILVGEESTQALDHLCDLTHTAYMAKVAAEIGKRSPAVEPKQVRGSKTKAARRTKANAASSGRLPWRKNSLMSKSRTKR